MNCEKCTKQNECTIYQDWLNTRDSCCPFSDYQKSLKKEKYTIPKEFHDKKIAGQSEQMMTNKEKLEELEDILHRKIEGDFDYEVLKKRLELLLLIAQIKKVNR